jgi:hypothetical protein
MNELFAFGSEEMTPKKMTPIEVGDVVFVDVGYRNGGYEAEVMWIGNMMASIEAGGKRWDIMKSRLTKKL